MLARRAVFVPAHHQEPEAEYDSSLKGALYALPVDPKGIITSVVLVFYETCTCNYNLSGEVGVSPYIHVLAKVRKINPLFPGSYVLV